MFSLRFGASALAVSAVLTLGLAACQSPSDKAYISAVNDHSKSLKDKLDKVTQTACKGGPSPDCTSAANDARAEADAMKADMDKNTPPSCVKDADKKIKDALGTLSLALTQLAATSAANDTTGAAGSAAQDQINKGADNFNAGIDDFNKASC